MSTRFNSVPGADAGDAADAADAAGAGGAGSTGDAVWADAGAAATRAAAAHPTHEMRCHARRRRVHGVVCMPEIMCTGRSPGGAAALD